MFIKIANQRNNRKMGIKKITLIKIIFLFALIGTLFSGYLTIKKLWSGTCAITEGCTYLLGYPTCIYGLFFFLIILIPSILLLVKKGGTRKSMQWVWYGSLAGLLFSGYYAMTEIIHPICKIGECQLFLPTCMWGFLMYIIIFISASVIKFNKESESAVN